MKTCIRPSRVVGIGLCEIIAETHTTKIECVLCFALFPHCSSFEPDAIFAEGRDRRDNCQKFMERNWLKTTLSRSVSINVVQIKLKIN